MFVETPHIPTARVTVAAVSGEYGEIRDSLKKLGIEIITVFRYPNLPVPVASHADLLLHHLGHHKIVAAKGDGDYINQLKQLGFQISLSEKKLDHNYPDDIPLDCLRVGKYLFGKAKHIDPIILKYCHDNKIEIVDVKQGYTKCSACIVNENTIITSDIGVEKACRGKGMDTLLIQNGDLSLPGYDYGFIGGCTGLIDKHTLAMAGDITYHPDGKRIINFLHAHDVTAVALQKGIPIDIGGILPLIQDNA